MESKSGLLKERWDASGWRFMADANVVYVVEAEEGKGGFPINQQRSYLEPSRASTPLQVTTTKEIVCDPHDVDRVFKYEHLASLHRQWREVVPKTEVRPISMLTTTASGSTRPIPTIGSWAAMAVYRAPDHAATAALPRPTCPLPNSTRCPLIMMSHSTMCLVERRTTIRRVVLQERSTMPVS